MRHQKHMDPGEMVAAILGGMFAVGFFGATLLPFSIGKYFGWLLLPPVTIIVLVLGLIILRTLFSGLR